MFEFTEISAVQQQIAQLTEQLNKLTSSIAPYQEAQNAATELVAKVEEHRLAMEAKGLAQESLNKWASALYEAGCGRSPSIDPSDKDLEIAALKASLQELEAIALKNLDYEGQIKQLEDERTVFKKDIADLIESSKRCLELEKRCETLEVQLKAGGSGEQSTKVEELERELLNCRGENKKLKFLLEQQQSNELQVGAKVGINPPKIKGHRDYSEYTGEIVNIKYLVEVQEEDDSTKVMFDGDNIYLASNSKEPLYTLGEKLDKGIEARSKILTSGDIVQLLDGRVATVTGFDGEGNIEVRLSNGLSVDYARTDLRWISSEQEVLQPPVVVTENVESTIESIAVDHTKKYQDFLAAITRNPKQWENLNWFQIRNLVDHKAEGFKELGLAGTTKAQRDKRAILMNERIAQLLADHIKEYSDRSDFEWIPKHLKEQVEGLLNPKVERIEKLSIVTLKDGDDIEWEVVKHDIQTNQVELTNYDTGLTKSVAVEEIKSVSASLIDF